MIVVVLRTLLLYGDVITMNKFSNYTIENIEDIAIIKIIEEILYFDEAYFIKDIHQSVEERKIVIFDLSHTIYVSSSIIGLMLEIMKKKKLIIVSKTLSPIYHTFGVMNLRDKLCFCDTKEIALELAKEQYG